MDGELTKKLWAGTFTDADLHAVRLLALEKKISAGELSSVLYTAANKERTENHLMAHAGLLAEALSRSDEYLEERRGDLTSEEWDVRQSILQESGKFEEALHAIEKGFANVTESTPVHVKAFLELGRADIYRKQKDFSKAKEALDRMHPLLVDHTLDHRQSIRLYRGLVRYYKAMNDQANLEVAKAIALRRIEETGAYDQKAKLERDISG